MHVDGDQFQEAALDHYQNWGANANEDQGRLWSRWHVFQQSRGCDLETLAVEVQVAAEVSEEIYARRQQIWSNSDVKTEFENRCRRLDPGVSQLCCDVVFGLRPVSENEIETFNNAVELSQESYHEPHRLYRIAEEDLESHLGRAIWEALQSNDPVGRGGAMGQHIRSLLTNRHEAHQLLKALENVKYPMACVDNNILSHACYRDLDIMRDIARSRGNVGLFNRIEAAGQRLEIL